MTPKTTLDLVIQISTDRRNNAALRLAGARRQSEEAKCKLDMLSRYRLGYPPRGGDGADAGTDQVRMANVRAFLDKLEQAIVQQQRELEACQSYANACFHVLGAEEKKLKSLEILRHQRIAESARAEKRSDQKRSDESGSRMARFGAAGLELRST